MSPDDPACSHLAARFSQPYAVYDVRRERLRSPKEKVILKIQFILSLIEKDADLNCLPKTIINWLND